MGEVRSQRKPRTRVSATEHPPVREHTRQRRGAGPRVPQARTHTQARPMRRQQLRDVEPPKAIEAFFPRRLGRTRRAEPPSALAPQQPARSRRKSDKEGRKSDKEEGGAARATPYVQYVAVTCSPSRPSYAGPFVQPKFCSLESVQFRQDFSEIRITQNRIIEIPLYHHLQTNQQAQNPFDVDGGCLEEFQAFQVDRPKRRFGPLRIC